MVTSAYYRRHEGKHHSQLRAILVCYEKQYPCSEEYLDEGNATSEDRPAFQQMISDLEETRPNIVLVHKLDRFARTYSDSAFYRREIQKAGARLVAIDQSPDY